MKNLQPNNMSGGPKTPHTLAFTPEQIAHIQRYGRERRTMKVPNILILEDQDFSRTLLQEMLRKEFPCHSAATAEQALSLYAEHLPCIAFLDIELPDINGHEVAAFLKKHDPNSYLVMVTANHAQNDVLRAQANNVQGFIAKPYSKQKIMASIDHYMTGQNKRY